MLTPKKYKTPVSTYTDSYRPPCSVKKTFQQLFPQKLYGDNKFVTQGLTVPQLQNPASRVHPECPINVSLQEYYRNTVATCWPGKCCLTRSEEKYNPIFVNNDKYNTWRTTPSTAWIKHPYYHPLLKKGTRMEAFLHSIPGPYIPKLTCLNQFERDVATSMMHRLQWQSPSLQPLYTIAGRGPFQGYYSPSSGHYYCMQGMDYHADGASALREHLYDLQDRVVRWDTSHFMKLGVQRGSYTIQPEFASEALCHP
ncbi:sperm microtubule inner protein 6 [Porphyrio hochstetteri]